MSAVSRGEAIRLVVAADALVYDLRPADEHDIAEVDRIDYLHLGVSNAFKFLADDMNDHAATEAEKVIARVMAGRAPAEPPQRAD